MITADLEGADINCDLTTAEGREELAAKTRELSGASSTLAVKRGTELADEGPRQGYANYSASKQAIACWVRRNAPTQKWSGAGVALNAIAPAVVVSPMTEQLRNSKEGLAQLEQVPMPLNDWLEREQAAAMLAFLTSEENTHLCGQVIFVDGGYDAITRGDST